MTCIIGYIDEKGVGHMAGDTAGTSVDGHYRVDNVHPKVFRNGEMLIGYTSSFRMGQILEHVFTAPERNDGLTDYQYMVKQVVPAIRKAFVEGNYMTKEDKDGGTFLIIYRGKLFALQDDFSVFERPRNFDSCGSGFIASNTAFETMLEYGLVSHLGVREALVKAIEITSRTNITVSGRVDYLNSNGESWSREALHR